MLDSSFWSLKFGDILTICAVGFSPLVAVGLQKWFEQIGSTHRQRLWIFKTLMTTRTAPLDTHVTDEAYRPQYHGNVQVELDFIRSGFVQILQGNRQFPVQLFPGNPEGAAKFEKLIDGTHPLRVELKRSKDGDSLGS